MGGASSEREISLASGADDRRAPPARPLRRRHAGHAGADGGQPAVSPQSSASRRSGCSGAVASRSRCRSGTVCCRPRSRTRSRRPRGRRCRRPRRSRRVSRAAAWTSRSLRCTARTARTGRSRACWTCSASRTSARARWPRRSRWTRRCRRSCCARRASRSREGLVVERAEFAAAPGADAAAAAARLMPAVVKPVRQGSSIGMSMVAEAGSHAARRSRRRSPTTSARWSRSAWSGSS